MGYERTLYPPIEPYEHGMLDVGAGHVIYWERCGTPGAKPVVFLHGGPGAGCSPMQRRQFDPELYDILLFDQRGCGRSTPLACLENNTTWDIVADMERLREMCGHRRWQVFGGSWGSTLGLAYAQSHPDRVTELILRGIFLSQQSELDWLTKFGASEFYPDGWDKFSGLIPESERDDLMGAYHRRLTGDSIEVQEVAAAAWNRWECQTLTLLPDDAMVQECATGANSVANARIEAHYFTHSCFLEESQLLKNAHRLKKIPGVIVQGRHDCCTPPAAAWALKQSWPEAELQIVPDGGHLFTEPGITDGLIRASDRFAGKNC